MERRARVRAALARGELVLAGALLGLLAAELCVRGFAPQDLVTSNLRFAALAGPGFRLQPDTFLPGVNGGPINSLGLRGPELAPRVGGERRVLVLGDSFTYGSGVKAHETFTARLEDLAGEDRQFVNGGTPAYGTERQARWLEALGEAVAPDDVLLAFFAGNDFTDNLTREDPSVLDGRIVGADALASAPWRLRARLWLEELHLYRLLERRLFRPPPPTEAEIAWMTDPGRVARHLEQKRDVFLQNEAERLAIYRRAETQDAYTERLYAETELALARVRDWCAAHGATLAVAILPDVVQVDAGVLDQLTARMPGLEPGRLDLERPQRAVRAWCEREGVAVVDVLPALRERGGAAYLDRDTHFSAAGHLAAAQAIARGLYGAP